MIQSVQWIAKTSTTSFPLEIISIGPLLGEICMPNTKMHPKCIPKRERVKEVSITYFGNRSKILPNLSVGTQKTAYPRDVFMYGV
jgi:hypothetical protein